MFFGSATSILVSTPPVTANDWHIVVALAALLAAASLVQFQCGFARAIIYQGGKSFFASRRGQQEHPLFTITFAIGTTPTGLKVAFGLINLVTNISFYWMLRLGLLTVMFYLRSVDNKVYPVFYVVIVLFEMLATATVYCINIYEKVLQDTSEQHAQHAATLQNSPPSDA